MVQLGNKVFINNPVMSELGLFVVAIKVIGQEGKLNALTNSFFYFFYFFLFEVFGF